MKWRDGFLQGKAPRVRLGMIFRSRLARGGCAAVLSASTVPELPVEMAQLLGQRVLGFGAVCFSIFVRHCWVAVILGVTRCRSQKHADEALAVCGPAPPAVIA
jgi:hypothetical protein